MKITATFLLLLTAASLFGQGANSASMLLQIDRDTLIHNNSVRSLIVPLTYSNVSNGKLVTYGLSAIPFQTSFKLSDFCEVKSTMVGTAFAIFGSDGREKNYRVAISDSFDQKPVTKETLDSIRKVSIKHLLQTKMQMLAGESISFEKELSIEDFNLQPGVYDLQIIYFCGERIFNVINDKKVKEGGIQIFQGCALSQKVPLVVK